MISAKDFEFHKDLKSIFSLSLHWSVVLGHAKPRNMTDRRLPQLRVPTFGKQRGGARAPTDTHACAHTRTHRAGTASLPRSWALNPRPPPMSRE